MGTPWCASRTHKHPSCPNHGSWRPPLQSAVVIWLQLQVPGRPIVVIASPDTADAYLGFNMGIAIYNAMLAAMDLLSLGSRAEGGEGRGGRQPRPHNTCHVQLF